MTVAIIGAGSFLAARLIEKLSQDLEIKLKLYSRTPHALPKHHYLTFRYDFPAVPLNLATLLDDDVIIFCAAAGVQSTPNLALSLEYEVNVFEPIRLFEFLKRSNYSGKFFSFGSYFECGDNENPKLFSEEEVLSSTYRKPNSYSLSKTLLSRFLFHQNQEKEKLTFCFYHLILSTIYGVGENENRIIPYIVRSIKEEKSLLLSEGKQTRQYTHVDDVANIIRKLLNHPYRSGIFNITVAQTITIKSLSMLVIKMAEAAFNKHANVSFNRTDRPDLSMEHLALDPSLAVKEIGWSPAIGLEEGIKEYLK